ncbi:hypothetical protein BHE74_00043576 [Ensete ventricosum]|nr:hypothetical protein BHE74_00043576 [Ensete ventricosum]
MMQLGTRLECVRSSLRVSGACQDNAREFTGRRLRLTRRLSGAAESQRVVQLGIRKVKGITFSGFPMAESSVSDGCTATAQDFE